MVERYLMGDGSQVMVENFREATKEDFKDIVENLYKSRPDVLMEDRQILFEGGIPAYNHYLMMFSDDVLNQLEEWCNTQNPERKDKLIKWDKKEKSSSAGIDYVQVSKVYIPGIGNIEAKQDKRLINGMFHLEPNGKSDTARISIT